MKLRNLFVSMIMILLCAGPMLATTPSNSPEPAQGADVDALFNQLKAILASRASQYNANIDVPQAKLFQIGQASAVIVPVASFSLADLGLLGLLEVGGPFTIKGTQLPPDSYRMELGGTLQQMLLYLRDSHGNRVVSIPVQFDSNITFPLSSGQVGTSGFFGGGRNPLTGLRVIGPNININFNLSATPPFIRNLTTCIGFIIPFGSGVFTIRFCF